MNLMDTCAQIQAKAQSVELAFNKPRLLLLHYVPRKPHLKIQWLAKLKSKILTQSASSGSIKLLLVTQWRTYSTSTAEHIS